MNKISKWEDLERVVPVFEKVDCDDEGDDYWQWYVRFYLDGEFLYGDYWHDRPDNVQRYNALVSAVNAGEIECDERGQ